MADQLANPHGLLGRLTGRIMVRGNGPFGRWVVQQLRAEWSREPARIAELGPGPGVGLEETLRLFPQARVYGADISPQMIAQSRSRNRREAEAGRLTLRVGDTSALAAWAPVDLVYAVHVLYFWPQPVSELQKIRGCLSTEGMLALGFQLREHLPKFAQRSFPRSGRRVYASQDEVTAVLREAGYRDVRYVVRGRKKAGESQLALARP